MDWYEHTSKTIKESNFEQKYSHDTRTEDNKNCTYMKTISKTLNNNDNI